ncbi:hypothetical protein K458DRAFT_135228 [Lentithecium fluviatile CBS 122367]|uniref:Uncharacterized protein n=1 Tax=Lentithecium fluviatile CBS 122367 TaxID=1168545 RepID=A0A6G1IKW6_9PLEO|nr:hypothetical protein K458DRAFT_135228 [Lentithecium fluviatile CBS 122367]
MIYRICLLRMRGQPIQRILYRRTLVLLVRVFFLQRLLLSLLHQQLLLSLLHQQLLWPLLYNNRFLLLL